MSFNLNEKDISLIHYFDSTETNIYYSINTNLFAKIDNERSKTISEINYQVKFHQNKYWINKIISNMSTENIEYTEILVVNLVDEIPSRSKMILDTLASEYINYTLENQFTVNEHYCR